MKYAITESQYDRLISVITGAKPDSSFITKIKSNFYKDQNIGEMILKSVEDGNYDIDGKPTDRVINFSIDGFPFLIRKSANGRGKEYTMELPLMNNRELSIGGGVLKKIFYAIADEHMDIEDYMSMYFSDNIS
jgi:hypothetical protein